LSGSEFQTVGPAEAKERQPKEQSVDGGWRIAGCFCEWRYALFVVQARNDDDDDGDAVTWTT